MFCAKEDPLFLVDRVMAPPPAEAPTLRLLVSSRRSSSCSEFLENKRGDWTVLLDLKASWYRYSSSLSSSTIMGEDLCALGIVEGDHDDDDMEYVVNIRDEGWLRE